MIKGSGVFILLALVSMLIISGCSQEGCGCDEDEQCNCLPDNPSDPDTDYHFDCSGGDACGCSCDEDDSRDGNLCNP